MEWKDAYNANQQPDEQQISDFIHNPLWANLNDYLQQAYLIKPKYIYSGCSMQQGWNIKYKKSGKSLCTLYPMDGYFIALVVIGPKEMTEAEFMIPSLSEYVQTVFDEVKLYQGSKWLMLDIMNWSTLLDMIKLINLRVMPKNEIEMEEYNG